MFAGLRDPHWTKPEDAAEESAVPSAAEREESFLLCWSVPNRQVDRRPCRKMRQGDLPLRRILGNSAFEIAHARRNILPAFPDCVGEALRRGAVGLRAASGEGIGNTPTNRLARYSHILRPPMLVRHNSKDSTI